MTQPRIRPSPKAVAFHVTRDQYEILKAECASGAARSLSELARSRVLRAIAGHSLVQVARKLEELEAAVEQLAEAVAHAPRGAGVSNGR